MNTPASVSSNGPVSRLSGYAANALRYWEPRRAIYNAALVLVVLGQFIAAWPGSYALLTYHHALSLFFLANVCYCAAYPADLFVQFAGLGKEWEGKRVYLLMIGTAFAGVMAHYVCMAMFRAINSWHGGLSCGTDTSSACPPLASSLPGQSA